MACSIEFGQEGWTTLYGIKTSNNIPFNWLVNDFNNERGPSNCETCKTDGMFEGIFYGLCETCCAKTLPCQCIYCRIAKKDGHKHIERRSNMCRFIKSIQSVINDLKRDYPTDDYGIVAEGIDSGMYILNLHTECQYGQLLNDFCLPHEVSQLAIGEQYLWQHNPKADVSAAAYTAAIKAAKRTGIFEWFQDLCGEEHMLVEADETEADETEAAETEAGETKKCDECGITISKGTKCYHCAVEHLPEWNRDEADEPDEDFEYCAECDTRVHIEEIDQRGYCLDCQNPEYDPVWPKGD